VMLLVCFIVLSRCFEEQKLYRRTGTDKPRASALT
jgi:hypothetical protein